MVPSATLSTTALATAAWAGPNICTAWVAPLIVTLLNMTVSGFAGTLGASTARSPLWPAVCVGEPLHEGGAGRAGLGPDDQIDVGDLVAVADQGLTDHEVV